VSIVPPSIFYLEGIVRAEGRGRKGERIVPA
jgi:hypothetical protein